MMELSDIFAHELTASVHAAGSLMMLVILLMAAVWMVRAPAAGHAEFRARLWPLDAERPGEGDQLHLKRNRSFEHTNSVRLRPRWPLVGAVPNENPGLAPGVSMLMNAGIDRDQLFPAGSSRRKSSLAWRLPTITRTARAGRAASRHGLADRGPSPRNGRWCRTRFR